MKEVMHNTYGFETVIWNFQRQAMAREHLTVLGGGGGGRGFIKRTADKLVSHGNDIADANEFYLALK